MTLYELFKTLHVIAAALWVGGGMLQMLLWTRARARPAADKLATIQDAEAFGQRYYPVLSVLTLAFGIAMMIEGDLSIGEPWIGIAIAGWLVSSVVGGAFYGPTMKKMTAAHEAGEITVTDALYDRILTVARFDSLLLILVVADMVIKPG